MAKTYTKMTQPAMPEQVIAPDDIQIKVSEQVTNTVENYITIGQLKAEKKSHEDRIKQIDAEIVEINKIK